MNSQKSISIELASPKFRPLIEPHRFKIMTGGRGGGRSHTVSRILVWAGTRQSLRILCAREIQKSIRDSVHKLLSDVIKQHGFEGFYRITQNGIIGANNSEFIFCGLAHNAAEIKSKEGIDICWVEEGERVSEDSWDYLVPTIRKPKSEIWITFNPDQEGDPTYKRFVMHPPPDTVLIHTNLDDNRYAPDELKNERDWCRKTDYDKYRWVWEGQCRKMSEAIIFKGKLSVEEFETPVDAQFYHGLDFGFAIDPTVLVRMFIQKRCLYIDWECWGIGVEIDELPTLFASMDTARRWKIIADSARPETISYLQNHGFDVTGTMKWNGSVEDGIEFLRSFDKIIIHPRCKHTIDDFKTYSYKTNKLTNEPLPIPLDKNNHSPDAVRYGLEPFIKQVGGIEITQRIT